MKFKNHFPQISRIYPALRGIFRLKYFIWAIMTIVIMLNIAGEVLPQDQFYSMRKSVLKTPFNPLSHQKLADSYLEVNPEQSRQEMILAEDYSDYKLQTNFLARL